MGNLLTLKRLKELLSYNPETGDFHWLVPRGRAKKGDLAGCTHGYGHRQITIDRKQYRAHRLAWFYIHGKWPEEEIDHIEHDQSDNAINLLRDVPHKENQKNRKLNSNNTSGVAGVCFRPLKNKWKAYISVNRKVKNLGEFTSFKEAVEARKEAEVRYGYHENHGK